MTRSMLIVAVLFGLGGAGCTFVRGTAYRPQVDERECMAKDLVGREMVLLSSLYTGELPGHDQLMLADSRHTDLIELYTHAGKQLPAPQMSGPFVPAGTRVKIQDVRFAPRNPIEIVQDDRPMGSPTAHPWVVMQRLDSPKSLPLVLALPRNLKTTRDFYAAVSELLVSPRIADVWQKDREQSVVRSIRDKRVTVGMSRAEVVASLGRPRNGDELSRTVPERYDADYGSLRIGFEGQRVVEVVDVAKLEAEAKAKADAEAAALAKAEAEAKAKELAEQKAREEEEARIEAAALAEAREAEAKEAADKAKAEQVALAEEAKREDRASDASEEVSAKKDGGGPLAFLMSLTKVGSSDSAKVSSGKKHRVADKHKSKKDKKRSKKSKKHR